MKKNLLMDKIDRLCSLLNIEVVNYSITSYIDSENILIVDNDTIQVRVFMKKKKSNECLNCGAEINDSKFCHNCGQPNREKILSLKQILHDFFGEYLTFDSKFFRSLFPLLFKPGSLTKEYVNGRRVNYILPLRLYLFTTFIFFFVLALNAKFDSNPPVNQEEKVPVISRDSLESILEENKEALPPEVKDIIVSNYDAAMEWEKIEKSDEGRLRYNISEDDSAGVINSYIKSKAKQLKSMGSEASKIFVKELINQIPKILFLLLPVFALILKLVYIRHKRLYVEHLIFSLHFHTFIFIILIFPLFISHWIVFLLAFLGINIYLYFSLHHYYQDTYVKSFFRLILISFSYLIALIPAIMLLIIFAIVSI